VCVSDAIDFMRLGGKRSSGSCFLSGLFACRRDICHRHPQSPYFRGQLSEANTLVGLDDNQPLSGCRRALMFCRWSSTGDEGSSACAHRLLHGVLERHGIPPNQQKGEYNPG